MGIIILAIFVCLVFTKALFSTYQNEQSITSEGNVYYLQYGSYVNELVMKDIVSKLDNYAMVVKDNKYYVYLGAYPSLENALNMQKYYEENNIYIYLKNDYLENEDTLLKIKALDNEASNVTNKKDLYAINQKIINVLKTSTK